MKNPLIILMEDGSGKMEERGLVTATETDH